MITIYIFFFLQENTIECLTINMWNLKMLQNIVMIWEHGALKLAKWCKNKFVYVRVVARLPQMLKSTFFEKFSSGGSLKETRREENFSKNVDVSL